MYKIDSELSINKLQDTLITSDILNFIEYDKIFIITEEKVYNLYSNHEVFNSNCKLIFINKADSYKTLEKSNYIINEMMNSGASRDSLLIGFGGGNITDITGFIASIYMRGINHVFIPTTLLAMVDASIGGKTGIDFKNIKNLLGTFKNPNAIYIDVEFLNTLNTDIIIDGFAEIIKYSLIFNKILFKNIIQKFESLIQMKNKKELENIILQSCKYKISIVLKDQFDMNKRMILNFGHTIGHALETYFIKERISHGQAIYHGMIAESFMSYELGYISKEEFTEISNFLRSIVTFEIKSFNGKKVLNLIKNDKKKLKHKMHFILLNKIGNAIIKTDIESKFILNGIKKVLG